MNTSDVLIIACTLTQTIAWVLTYKALHSAEVRHLDERIRTLSEMDRLRSRVRNLELDNKRSVIKSIRKID